jgi:hypothetical protein
MEHSATACIACQIADVYGVYDMELGTTSMEVLLLKVNERALRVFPSGDYGDDTKQKGN